MTAASRAPAGCHWWTSADFGPGTHVVEKVGLRPRTCSLTYHFPRDHRRRLHSTNPLERLDKEIKRRTRVVGIFPTGTPL